MKSGDVINGILPGFIAGCVLYVISSFVGPMIGPGWTDVLQGISIFVGLIWALLGIRRRQSRDKLT
jgi:hypothetical protein